MELHDTEYSRRVTQAWIQVQRPVYAYIASMINNHADADDVMQAVAMAMIDGLDQYDSSRPLLTWSLGIARNKVLEYLRRNGRDRHVFGPEVMTAIESAYERVEQENDQIHEALSGCLRELTGRQRQVLQLRYHEDLKPAAIGQRMGTTSPVVSNLLQRARGSLRKCMSGRLRDLRMEIDP